MLPTFLALKVDGLASRCGELREKEDDLRRGSRLASRGGCWCNPLRQGGRSRSLARLEDQFDFHGSVWKGGKRKETPERHRSVLSSSTNAVVNLRETICNQLQLHTVSRKRVLRASSSGRAAATSDVVGAVQRCRRNAWGSLGPTAPSLPTGNTAIEGSG